MFRYKRSIKELDYDTQGNVYFTSKRYKRLSVGEQETIRRLCQEAGGQHAKALFEFVTTDAGASEVCVKHFLSEKTLERAVRRYYLAFAREW